MPKVVEVQPQNRLTGQNRYDGSHRSDDIVAFEIERLALPAKYAAKRTNSAVSLLPSPLFLATRPCWARRP